MCRVVFGLIVLFPLYTSGEDSKSSLPVEVTQIVNQNLYRDSTNACAPTALCNALKFGEPDLHSVFQSLRGNGDENKLRVLRDRYFRSRRSAIADDRFRWGFHGVYVADLAVSCNELLEEKNLDRCQSGYLDRIDGETDQAHISRIRSWMDSSLKAGFPPILSLRSFVVRSREERQREPRWEKVFHHFVVIHCVAENAGGSGFEAGVIDSNGGKLSTIHIHQEANSQQFTVLKGNDLIGEWVSGRPFLLVTAPGMNALRPANLKWSERYIITANFLIGRF
ncbi:MAG: hypothetical protein P1V20_02665 [Verrucomicrobiales bacterium]|nr:hypothetical protein [Verrucomicrobiales bacterium]